MNATTLILLVFSLVATVTAGVDANFCPKGNTVDGSCCEITINKLNFTTVAQKPSVYNITNFCGKCEEVAWLKDTVMVSEGYSDGNCCCWGRMISWTEETRWKC